MKNIPLFIFFILFFSSIEGQIVPKHVVSLPKPTHKKSENNLSEELYLSPGFDFSKIEKATNPDDVKVLSLIGLTTIPEVIYKFKYVKRIEFAEMPEMRSIPEKLVEFKHLEALAIFNNPKLKIIPKSK